MRWIILVGLIVGCFSWGSLGTSLAEPQRLNNWAEGAPGTNNGASRLYYNRIARLRWANYMGDWADAEDQAQGNQPFATATATVTEAWVIWDVTSLVSAWVDGTYNNQGFFLRKLNGGPAFDFRSKEFSEAAMHPRLVVVADNQETVFPVVADTYLEQSTYQSFGDSSRLRVSSSRPSLLRFDLQSLPATALIQEARLELYASANSGSGNSNIGVFRSNQTHADPDAPVVMGLAEQYPGDFGIDSHPDVVFFEPFEVSNWDDQWSFAKHFYEIQNQEVVSGNALEVLVKEGDHSGINAAYKFGDSDKLGFEPEEMYVRYYVRLADDWNPIHQTGNKFPGFSGTYGVAGNGGNPSNGTNGWSARGHFFANVPDGNPAAGHTAIGNYTYHADQAGDFGTITYWLDNYGGLLGKNRWYCLEQYLKMNTPGQNDGVIRAWVDGRQVHESTTWRWRDIDTLKIEQFWFIVYNGGTETAPFDYHLYFDNLVIASSYIGPRIDGGPPVDTTPPAEVQNLEIN